MGYEISKDSALHACMELVSANYCSTQTCARVCNFWKEMFRGKFLIKTD